MGRKAGTFEYDAANDTLADCYHEVGIHAVSAAAIYCQPLKRQPAQPAFYDMLNMVEPKTC